MRRGILKLLQNKKSHRRWRSILSSKGFKKINFKDKWHKCTEYSTDFISKDDGLRIMHKCKIVKEGKGLNKLKANINTELRNIRVNNWRLVYEIS